MNPSSFAQNNLCLLQREQIGPQLCWAWVTAFKSESETITKTPRDGVLSSQKLSLFPGSSKCYRRPRKCTGTLKAQREISRSLAQKRRAAPPLSSLSFRLNRKRLALGSALKVVFKKTDLDIVKGFFFCQEIFSSSI